MLKRSSSSVNGRRAGRRLAGRAAGAIPLPLTLLLARAAAQAEAAIVVSSTCFSSVTSCGSTGAARIRAILKR